MGGLMSSIFSSPPERDFKTIKHQVPYLCHTSIIGPSNLELTQNESGKIEAALTAAFALKWVETIFEKGLVHLQKSNQSQLNTRVYMTPGLFRSLEFFIRHYKDDYPLREGRVLYVYGNTPPIQPFKISIKSK